MSFAKRFYALGTTVYDRERETPMQLDDIAECRSMNLAKRIANALNLYRPKVRRRKSAEKAVNSRP